MEVRFANRKLQKLMGSPEARLRNYGRHRGGLLGKRFDQMVLARNLAALENQPGSFHRLRADRAGQWGASLDGPYRLIFRPLSEDAGREPADIVVVEIIEEPVDYHGS